ncbi:hypothetical protein [Geomicrobium sp. JCM 19039]|uniref:hypothetical protein n=1 Tax=Geomicrobium sp. JCM 19039 TaxID=1460636 RepID=UPI0005A6623E|nr:hypothetical protein [Geomicrobium sp. JCM 19039]
MSKIEKEFKKIVNSPNNTDFKALRRVAERYGCIFKHGGSHWKMIYPPTGETQMISVHGGKVKTVYVKKVIRLIEEIIEEDDNHE